MTTWYISGHLDLTQEEFELHYVPRIAIALAGGDNFVVGDARGCDAMAQQFLQQLGADPRKVCVFHMLEAPRNYAPGCGFALIGGYGSDELRDSAMTRASDDDIAWVRSKCTCCSSLQPICKKKRNSGTAKNLQRRIEWNREKRIHERKEWPRMVITESYGDDVDLHLHDPASEHCAHPELAVPVPPGLTERYEAACKEYYAVQHEIRKAQLEAEEFKD